MKIRFKYLLFVMLLAVLIVAPTGLALAAPPDSAPRHVAADEDDPDEGEDETQDEGDDNSDSPYCTGEEIDRQHPVATNIAATYGVDYEEVIGYFCEGYGFGEIMLAYETGEFTGELAVELLDRKGKGHAWGLIWKELGLIGNEKDGGAAPGHGRGKPDWAGKPDHANGPSSNSQGNGNQDCPGNSCSNPGQGNDKNNDDSTGNNGNHNGQGVNNGNQDRGDTDDVDDEDSDS